MKKLLALISLLSWTAYADTPPPGIVKAKTYSGDGVSAITATGSALDVHVTNSGGLSTVNQGDAGSESWLVDVTSTVLPTGASTSAKQPDFGLAGVPSDDVITIQGHNSGYPLTVDGSSFTQPVSGTFWQSVQPVAVVSPLPAGTNSIGTVNVNGTVPISGIVTANAGSGTFLVDGSAHIQPISAASPVPVTQSTSPWVVSGAVDQGAPGPTTSPWPIEVENFPSSQNVVVTNTPTVTANAGSGTFLVDGSAHTQPISGPVSLASPLPSGTNIIGKVSIDQTTPGTTNLVALSANQSVNVAQINGNTTLTGNGVTGTGSQRVTIASDNSPIAVKTTPAPSSLTIKQAAITVGTSAVRLTNDGSAPPSTRVLLVAQLITGSTANCYFGSSSVTTTSTTRGIQMFPAQIFSFNNDAGDYYVICDASSQTVFITEQE